MTTFIPVNGKNERMGKLFRTPKHQLLYHGAPAIDLSIANMNRFGKVKVLLGEQYEDVQFCDNVRVRPTENVIDTLKQIQLKDHFFIVDCDVIPLNLNPPKGTTAYLFKNKNQLSQHSNFDIKDGLVSECNEKGKILPYAGAGVYYFNLNDDFYNYAIGAKTVAEIFANMVRNNKPVSADTTSNIFRFGTIQDICD